MPPLCTLFPRSELPTTQQRPTPSSSSIPKGPTPAADLPPYYLVYFLLVDLLGFPNLGQFEKVAWSVPIDFNGQTFLIEHRKLGVGVFAHDAAEEEARAQQIVTLIKQGVKVAEPFFEWLADRAVQDSKLNVINNSDELFERFEYFVAAHRNMVNEARERAEERHIEKRNVEGGTVTTLYMPATELRNDARWLALAAIDAFLAGPSTSLFTLPFFRELSRRVWMWLNWRRASGKQSLSVHWI